MITQVSAPTLPRIDWDAITFVHLYHDGPLTGLCTFEGRVHYFEVDPDSEYGERLYVYELTGEEVARELELRRLFEAHLGTYWSYDLPQAEQQVRRPADRPGYDAAVAAAFPGFDRLKVGNGYSKRSPVAVISSHED